MENKLIKLKYAVDDLKDILRETAGIAEDIAEACDNQWADIKGFAETLNAIKIQVPSEVQKAIDDASDWYENMSDLADANSY